MPPDALSTILARHPELVYLKGVEGSNAPHALQTLLFSIMRKIERQMNNAIANGVDFKSANTMVAHSHDGVNTPVSHVFLHGNKIAEVGDNFIRLFDGGWQTVTTKSRLNAILEANGCGGERVFQTKGVWFVTINNGKDNFVTVPFFSGMRLN